MIFIQVLEAIKKNSDGKVPKQHLRANILLCISE